MATSENKTVYQFDDDSLLKFAKAIANAVSERYIDTDHLPANLLGVVQRDSSFFPAIFRSNVVEITTYRNYEFKVGLTYPDPIGRAITIDSSGKYVFATGEVGEPIIGVVSELSNPLGQLIQKYGVINSTTNAAPNDTGDAAIEEEDSFEMTEDSEAENAADEIPAVAPEGSDEEFVEEDGAAEEIDPADSTDTPNESATEVQLLTIAVLGEVSVVQDGTIESAGEYAKVTSGGLFTYSSTPTAYRVIHVKNSTSITIFMAPQALDTIEITGVVSKNGEPVNGVTVDLNPSEEV